MSSNNQVITQTSASLFDGDDDIDDDTFLGYSNNGGGGGGGHHHHDAHIEQLRQEKSAVENRMLESSKNSLRLLNETEQVGMATAQELAKQREQLENTNKQLDQINSTLRSSQKHINGLKSVFGGLKNYLTGQRNVNAAAASGAPMSSAGGGSNVGGAVSPTGAPASLYESHPVTRLRSDESYQTQQHQQQQNGSRSTFNEQLDDNLDLMSGNLARLKGLAIDMHEEIESQNDLIDDISTKVEGTDLTIQHQNRDLNKMLKK